MKFRTPPSDALVRTLDPMTRRRRDDDLRRYFAYRCMVWKQETGKEWKDLADALHVARPEVTAFINAVNGSHKKIENFAAALGPQSHDLFQQLARSWAEQYPKWEPADPLPERITHTGDPLLDGTAGGLTVYSESFRRAARVLTGMTGCSIEQARDAAQMAWKANHGHAEATVFQWVAWMEPHIQRLLKSSGERPSVKVEAAPKTGDKS